MRGVNPAHINACFPKLPGIKKQAASSEGKKSEASGSKAKKTYPDQPNGILKTDQKGNTKAKSNPKTSDSASSNARRVRINPEPEVREFGALEDMFSPRSRADEGAPRLRRSESMPADLAAAHAANDREPLALPPKPTTHEAAGPSAPPSSPQSPSRTGNPAHHIQPLDQYLAEHGARPMTLADHLERPLTPERPGPFGAWDSPPGSPASSPHAEGRPGLTRTASEVGALFGGEGIEAGSPAAHAAPTPPTAEGDGRKPAGLLGISVGGAALAAGATVAAVTAIAMGSQGDGGQ